MIKTDDERAAERLTMDYPVPVKCLPKARRPSKGKNKLVVHLSKGVAVRAARAVLDVDSWNTANPLHPKDERGRWANTPAREGLDALKAVPAQVGNDGLNENEPGHVPGPLEWVSDDPGWSAQETARRLASLEGYRGSDYYALNRKNRGLDYDRPHLYGAGDATFADFDARLDAVNQDLDAVLDASRLTDDIIVLRGTATGFGVFGSAVKGDLTGFEWTEASFVSTSADPDVARNFTATGLVLEIAVPRGTGAVVLSGAVDGLGDKDEAEIMLERGLRFRVVQDDRSGESRRLKVEVVS